MGKRRGSILKEEDGREYFLKGSGKMGNMHRKVLALK
jgi:hypothetical protein